MRSIGITRGLIAAAASAMSISAPAARRRTPAPHVETLPVYRKSAKLNRSRHWPFAATYEEARAMSPFPDRPVR